ncbi:MAG: hypothetical protein AAFY71_14810 [Bacteroidota bacterium]
MKNLFGILILFVSIVACDTPKAQTSQTSIQPEAIPTFTTSVSTLPDSFSRESALQRLEQKTRLKSPTVVHILVPLCDNEHQGIVPVSSSLGNGTNLRTNLYWGARYGIKSHFKISSKWKLVASQMDITPNILERVIFESQETGFEHIKIVADAYRGDKMKECLTDYFSSLAGKKKGKIIILDKELGIHGNADLIVFNGHNGLMDTEVPLITSEDQQIRDASAIGCISHPYFKSYLQAAGGYPLLMTTNLLAPEAYVVESLIQAWMRRKSGPEIRTAAGKAYDRYQKCGIRGATRLFRTGW